MTMTAKPPADPTDPTIGKDGKRYPLTAKQLKFIDEYLQSGNATDAYRTVYDCSGWSDIAIRVKGSQALDNPKIATEISRRRSEVAANVEITVETLIAELDEAKALASEQERGGAAAMVAAILGKAKLLGFMVDKVDQTVRQAKPSDHRPDLQGIRGRISSESVADTTIPSDNHDAAQHKPQVTH